MTSRIHVVSAEDQLMYRGAIYDALTSPDAVAEGITYGGNYSTLPETVAGLQAFTQGQKPLDCLILDANLDWSGDLASYFNTGENKPVIAGKKGFLGIGRTEEQDPNQISLGFMNEDRMMGADARNALRLVEMMRAKGITPWQQLAIVGYSGDPMESVMAGTGLKVDYDLNKSLKPDDIITAVLTAVNYRRKMLGLVE